MRNFITNVIDFIPDLLDDWQERITGHTRFPYMYIFDEDFRSNHLLIETHYLGFMNQINRENSNISQLLYIQESLHYENYQEAKKLLNALSFPDFLDSENVIPGLFDLFIQTLSIFQAQDLQEFTQKLLKEHNPIKHFQIEFLIQYLIQQEKYQEGTTLALKYSQNLRLRDTSKALYFFNLSLCSLYLDSKHIDQSPELIKTQYTQIESMLKDYPIDDNHQKQQRFNILFQIKKSILLQTKQYKEIQKHIKAAYELKMERQWVEMQKQENKIKSIKQAKYENLKYLCEMVSQSTPIQINQIDKLFCEINETIFSIFSQTDYIANMSKDYRGWFMKYQKYEIVEDLDRQIQIEMKNNNDKQYFMPHLSSFIKHINLFDGKVQSHVEFLIKVYLLYQKYYEKMSYVLDARTKDTLQYKSQIQQLSILYFILSKQGVQYIYDPSIKPTLSLKEVQQSNKQLQNQIQIFNLEYSNLCEVCKYQLSLDDLEQFNYLINDGSAKQLFMSLQDRYEESLQEYSDFPKVLNDNEKISILNNFYNITRLFKSGLFGQLTKVSNDMLLAEILGQYDEIFIISSSIGYNFISIDAIITNISNAFLSFKWPSNNNYFLQHTKLNEQQATCNIDILFGNKLKLNNLIHYYCLHSIVSQKQLNQKQPLKNIQMYFHYLDILTGFYLFDDAHTFLQSLCRQQQAQASIYFSLGLLIMQGQLKFSLINMKSNPNFSLQLLFKGITAYHQFLRYKVECCTINRVQSPKLQFLGQLLSYIECLKLISIIETMSSGEDKALKSIYIQYRISKPTIILDQDSQDQMYSIFGLQFTKLISFVSEIYSQLYLLKNKNYKEFIATQVQIQNSFQSEVLDSIKNNNYFLQSWKFILVLLDVTYKVVNIMQFSHVKVDQLKDISIYGFKDVSRTIHLLKIILEETILRGFSNTHEEDQQKFDCSSFKPKINVLNKTLLQIKKVLIIGMDDLTPDNVETNKIQLELVLETQSKQRVRLRVNENELKVSLYNVEKLNMMVNLCLPLLIQCTELWISYIPKDFLEYQDSYLLKIKKIGAQQDNQWLSSEKNSIKQTQERFIELLESLQMQLNKIESILNRELLKYISDDRIFETPFVNVQNFFTSQGLGINAPQLHHLESNLQKNLYSKLESYQQPIKLILGKFKQLYNQIRHRYQNF